MARPLNRNQQLENAAFLKALRRTGNVRLAARETGVAYGTMQYRRRQHPALATKWDTALAFAGARLRAKGLQGPVATATDDDAALRTKGGEPVVVRLRSGALQVRRAQPGKVTRQAEQGFLLALSATANISLAAASVGVAEAAFHRRKRQNPGFAREMRWALAQGVARLEEALMAGFLQSSHDDDAWRHNEAPDPPRVTPQQALQLIYLNQKAATIGWEELRRRRRPGETADEQSAAIGVQYRLRVKRDAENTVREGIEALAARLAPSPHEPPAPVLPDLAQVTGWSKADPATVQHGERGLFGGWRAEHLTPEQRAAALAKAQARRR